MKNLPQGYSCRKSIIMQFNRKCNPSNPTVCVSVFLIERPTLNVYFKWVQLYECDATVCEEMNRIMGDCRQVIRLWE